MPTLRWSSTAGSSIRQRQVHYASGGRARATGWCHQSPTTKPVLLSGRRWRQAASLVGACGASPSATAPCAGRADALPFAAGAAQFPGQGCCGVFSQRNGSDFLAGVKSGPLCGYFDALTCGCATPRWSRKRWSLHVAGFWSLRQVELAVFLVLQGIQRALLVHGCRGNGIGCVVCPKLTAGFASWLWPQ